MAITTIRSTYALDVETVRALERMAQRWKVSKSEALRRAIRAAAAAPAPLRGEALHALDRLQRALALTPAQARAWAARTRTERGAWWPPIPP
ncbi:MAG: ribbon-helix-helix protein, CopG family [Candidatus Rokubacteria bacterium]|nr:ribbon-helix-helix protein, CopG family [Candidatus Rokubacteria bacterium]